MKETLGGKTKRHHAGTQTSRGGKLRTGRGRGRGGGEGTDGLVAVAVDHFRHVGSHVEVVELDVGEGIKEVVDRLSSPSAQQGSNWGNHDRPEPCRYNKTCAEGASRRAA